MDDVPAEEGAGPIAEGLRDRKKRLTRKLISDTATAMFLEDGFDEVKVADVAEACGVSEKTVYNYFPTKESLLLDREDDMAAQIRRAFGPGSPARSPIAAALEILEDDLRDLRTEWVAAGSDVVDLTLFRRFTALIDSTPSLRAAQRDMMDRLARVTAETMAARAGVGPDEPEPQIAATSILGLWSIQFQALRRYSDGKRSVGEIHDLVLDEVRRAARLIESGLWSFSAMVQGGTSREQLQAASDSAQQAARQVAATLKQAKTVWRQLQAELEQAHDEHTQGRWEGRRRPDHDAERQVRREINEAQRQRRREIADARRAWRDPGPG